MFNPFGVGGVVLRLRTRGALRDPGLCCWTASQSLEHCTQTPTGFNTAACATPSGLLAWSYVLTRGALRDPGLLLLDRFAVTLSEPTI
jgi:hypothetical protein